MIHWTDTGDKDLMPRILVMKGYRGDTDRLFLRHFSHFCCVLDFPVFYYSRTYVYLGVQEPM